MAGAKAEFRQAEADQAWEAGRSDRPIFWRLQSRSNAGVEYKAPSRNTVGQSALYALDDLLLELDSDEQESEDLSRLLQELSWARLQSSSCKSTLYLLVRSNSGQFKIPQNSHAVLRTDDFLGFEVGDDFFLTDGSSVFHLRPPEGEAYARIARSFFTKPKLAQANFWCFGLLKLLRPLGIYSLHAAGLATKDGEGVLLVGPSGSGKSTLAIGLIRAGWSYLSDDAVLLRQGSEAVEAIACRRSFYIDAVRSAHYCDLGLGEEEPDSNGARRRRLGINESYPGQYLPQCLPRVLIFPCIKRQDQSTLKPIDRVSALRFILAQSAPQLFDRSTMSGHLELLKRLLQQTETYELNAGTDLYHEPAKLIDLLREARGAGNCRVSSLS